MEVAQLRGVKFRADRSPCRCDALGSGVLHYALAPGSLPDRVEAAKALDDVAKWAFSGRANRQWFVEHILAGETNEEVLGRKPVPDSDDYVAMLWDRGAVVFDGLE